MTLGERMKARRLQKDMTLEDVAKQVGVSRQTIQRYETGTISNVPSDKIELIAAALDTTPAGLMGWEEPQDDDKQAYYLDPEAAELAQEVYDRPELRVLFDATRNVSKEDIQFVIDMIERMKK